jgi:putative addiction module component (TIGR02574 family)
MSPSGTNLLESVLALPEVERAEIAEAILSSLDGSDELELDHDAFLAELRRRSQEMKDDPSTCIPWSELKNQL